MGVRVRWRPERETWQVDASSPHLPRRIRKDFAADEEAEAQRYAQEVRAWIAQRELGLGPAPTVAGLCRLRLDAVRSMGRKPGTLAQAERIFAKHILPAFAELPARELRPEDLGVFVDEKRAAGLAWETISGLLKEIQAGVNFGVERHLLDRAPVARVGRIVAAKRDAEGIPAAAAEDLEDEDADVAWWTPEELAQILALTAERDRELWALLRVLADTGMRRGEALALRWPLVDFARGEIGVRWSISNDVVTKPKTRRSRRQVVMIPELAEVLHELRAARGGESAHPWIFAQEDGRPWKQARMVSAWRRLQDRFEAARVRRLKLHCLRHTWATHALAAGAPIPWVSQQLGHGSAAFTLRVYAHAMPLEPRDLGWLRARYATAVASPPLQSVRHQEVAK